MSYVQKFYIVIFETITFNFKTKTQFNITISTGYILNRLYIQSFSLKRICILLQTQ